MELVAVLVGFAKSHKDALRIAREARADGVISKYATDLSNNVDIYFPKYGWFRLWDNQVTAELDLMCLVA